MESVVASNHLLNQPRRAVLISQSAGLIRKNPNVPNLANARNSNNSVSVFMVTFEDSIALSIMFLLSAVPSPGALPKLAICADDRDSSPLGR